MAPQSKPRKVTLSDKSTEQRPPGWRPLAHNRIALLGVCRLHQILVSFYTPRDNGARPLPMPRGTGLEVPPWSTNEEAANTPARI
jgi:hypothetical protein